MAAFTVGLEAEFGQNRVGKAVASAVARVGSCRGGQFDEQVDDPLLTPLELVGVGGSDAHQVGSFGAEVIGECLEQPPGAGFKTGAVVVTSGGPGLLGKGQQLVVVERWEWLHRSSSGMRGVRRSATSTP